MPLSALEKRLGEGIQPVYVLVGPQPYQLEMAGRLIIRAVPLGAMAEMNTDVFHIGADSVVDLPRLANSLPMMSKRRLIIVKNWHKATAKEKQAVTGYLESPADFTVLVLMAEKLDGRDKLPKLAKKHGLVLEFERLYESKMRPWVQVIAKELGVQLARETVDCLIRAVGPDLSAVAREMEKAALHAGAGPVSPEDVAAVMSAVKEQTFYQLFEAIAEKQTAEALRILKEMMEQGQAPLAILGSMSRTLRQLTVARLLLQEKMNENDAARALGVAPWLAKKTMAQARSFSNQALRRALISLARVDLALKDGRSLDRAILERLLLELCGRR